MDRWKDRHKRFRVFKCERSLSNIFLEKLEHYVAVYSVSGPDS